MTVVHLVGIYPVKPQSLWSEKPMDSVPAITDICRRERRSVASRWGKEGRQGMLGYFINAFVAVQGAHGALLQRARTERGASMVEYALLVGLIAVVAVVAIMALGNGIQSLFGSANSCVGGLNSTAC